MFNVFVVIIIVLAFFACKTESKPIHTQTTASTDPPQIVPSIHVPKLKSGLQITIDGSLADSAWSTAATTGSFVNVSSGASPAAGTPFGSAKILWDTEFIYFGIEVLDTTITGGFDPTAKDPHLWERDTVEVMFDPDGDGDNIDYYEIQINPQNLVFDTQYDRYNFPNGNGQGPFGHEEWSSSLLSAVQVHGTMDNNTDVDVGYIVEAKIPWKAFPKAKASPPSFGSFWRMNFYAMQNNGGSAWSPILGQGNFHRASRFGRVYWDD